MDARLQECREARNRGQTPDELMQLMHQRGLTITEAIKALVQLYQMSLREAKEKASASPYWRPVVDAAGPFHDQLTEDLQDLVTLGERRHEPREPLADVEKRLSKRRKIK